MLIFVGGNFTSYVRFNLCFIPDFWGIISKIRWVDTRVRLGMCMLRSPADWSLWVYKMFICSSGQSIYNQPPVSDLQPATKSSSWNYANFTTLMPLVQPQASQLTPQMKLLGRLTWTWMHCSSTGNSQSSTIQSSHVYCSHIENSSWAQGRTSLMGEFRVGCWSFGQFVVIGLYIGSISHFVSADPSVKIGSDYPKADGLS